MHIVNSPYEDNHMHTLNFSDSLDTINGIVRYVGEIGLKSITITDHSQGVLDYYKERGVKMNLSDRRMIKRWVNPFNNGVKVRFGLEADLMDENGTVCDYIGKPGINPIEERLILSAHRVAYQGDPAKVTQGLIKAIERNYERIIAVGHPCSRWDFAEQIDIKELCKVANDYGVPLELNGKNFALGNTDRKQLEILLEYANQVMVNSDAHQLAELRDGRLEAFEYLRKSGFIIPEDTKWDQAKKLLRQARNFF